LLDVNVELLRSIWRQPDDDPMYFSYPVTPPIAEVLRDHVADALQLNDYDYYLEYYDTSSSRPGDAGLEHDPRPRTRLD
jgi:hypothetical protein